MKYNVIYGLYYCNNTIILLYLIYITSMEIEYLDTQIKIQKYNNVYYNNIIIIQNYNTYHTLHVHLRWSIVMYMSLSCCFVKK